MVLSCLFFIFIEFKEFLHLFIVGVYAYVCSHLFLGVSVQVREPLEQVHHVGPKYWLRLSDFPAPRI